VRLTRADRPGRRRRAGHCPGDAALRRTAGDRTPAAGARGHTLRHPGGAAPPAAWEAVDPRGREAEAREAPRRGTGHVRHNARRTDSPRCRALGGRIGSGHGEAARQAVVGRRLQGAGLRGGEAGADAVGPSRAPFQSEEGRGEAFGANAP
jgi:hypothetical protein